MSRCISAAIDSGGSVGAAGRGGAGTAHVPRRVRFASRPKWRMRMKPRGTTWRRKRRRNSSACERHDLHAVVVGVVLPAEADAAVAVIDEPIIRERDAVRVPPEVVEHLLGTGEGPLRIHDPVDGPQPTEEAGEGCAIGQIGGAPGEGQLARVECALQGRRDTSRERPSTAPGPETGTTLAQGSTASRPRPRRRR